MKFGLYLSTHSRDVWRSNYIDYTQLKKIIKEVLSSPYSVYVPTQLSLNSRTSTGGSGPLMASPQFPVATHHGGSSFFTDKGKNITPQEYFFVCLEKEVASIDKFTKDIAASLRSSLAELQARISQSDLSDSSVREQLMETSRELSNEYLHLEKYVNLNYAGLQKILKKHDKLLPNAPCFQFYMGHISGQPWVRGDHHDLQVTLTKIFTVLHRAHGSVDVSLMQHNHEEHTRKFWVNTEDLVQVKHIILQHLPASDVPQCDDEANTSDDQSLVNHLILDNSSLELYHNLLYGRPYCNLIQLRWRGLGIPETLQVQRKMHKEGWRPEVCIRDSFPLQESKVADFLLGRWTFADARKYLMQQQDQQTRHDHKKDLGSLFDANGNIHTTPSQTESERLAQEYNLFKTFTEVQRLVESKSLQPMVRIVHRETEYEEAQVPGLAGRFKVEIEEDIEAMLEYSYDGMLRLANGLWQQEEPADRIVLPYALIHVHHPRGKDFAETHPPRWLQELIDSRLIMEVHDFSKMLFAVAGLMPDMVRAVPVWIDDQKIQRALYTNVLLHGTMPPSNEAELGDIMKHTSSLRASGLSTMSEGLERAKSVPADLHTTSRTPTEPNNVTALDRVMFGVAGWQMKLAERARNQGYAYKAQVVFEEPDQLMRNERMLLTWLTLAIHVGGLAVIILGFAAKSYPDPDEDPTIHISELTGFVLLFCAISICSYGIGVFLWRGSHMYQLHPRRYDDTIGTLWLNLILVVALFGLFWLNVADLVESFKSS